MAIGPARVGRQDDGPAVIGCHRSLVGVLGLEASHLAVDRLRKWCARAGAQSSVSGSAKVLWLDEGKNVSVGHGLSLLRCRSRYFLLAAPKQTLACKKMSITVVEGYHEVAKRLQVDTLSLDDVDEIFALYTLGRSTTRHGFLAVRTKDYFCEVLRRPEQVLGVGIWDQSRLVGYSICHRVAENPYEGHPLLSKINARTSTVYHGGGTVVHPAYHGRMLARRMWRLRWQQIKERQIDHVLGLIDVNNLISVGNAVLAGALLVGFAYDETSLNYIAYTGRFNNRLRTEMAPIMVDWRNHDEQRRLFAEGQVGCQFASNNVTSSGERKGGARQLAFRPI